MPLHEMTMDGFQADLNVLLSAVEAKAKACDSGSSHSDCSQFSFNLFKNVYASLNFSIIHHGALLARNPTQYNQKNRAADESTARAILQNQFCAILHVVCNACGVVTGSAASLATLRRDTTDSSANEYDSADRMLLCPLPLGGRHTPKPPSRAVSAMYALYCLHQTQLLMPAEPIRVTPLILALLVRLERRLLLAHFTNPCGAAGVVTSLLHRKCFQTASYPGAVGYNSINHFARAGAYGFGAVVRPRTSGAVPAGDDMHPEEYTSPNVPLQLRMPVRLHGGILSPRDYEQDEQLIGALVDDTDDASY